MMVRHNRIYGRKCILFGRGALISRYIVGFLPYICKLCRNKRIGAFLQVPFRLKRYFFLREVPTNYKKVGAV